MRSGSRLLRGSVPVFALWLGGCCGGHAPASKFPTAEAALERMHDTYACSGGVSGEAKLDYFGGAHRVRGDLLYLAKLPGSVRLDIVSPFGATISTLTSDGQRFGLLDLRNKTFTEGEANACNLGSFTGVPMPPHALVQLLRGEAPVLVHDANAASIEWSCDHYAVEIPSRNGATERLELVPWEGDLSKPYSSQRLTVTRVTVEQLDVTLYDVQLRGHRLGRTAPVLKDPEGIDEPVPPSGPVCDAPIPTRIRMEVPGGDHNLLVDNGQVFHNPPLAGNPFSQGAPASVSVRRSPCGP